MESTGQVSHLPKILLRSSGAYYRVICKQTGFVMKLCETETCKVQNHSAEQKSRTSHRGTALQKRQNTARSYGEDETPRSARDSVVMHREGKWEPVIHADGKTVGSSPKPASQSASKV